MRCTAHPIWPEEFCGNDRFAEFVGAVVAQSLGGIVTARTEMYNPGGDFEVDFKGNTHVVEVKLGVSEGPSVFVEYERHDGTPSGISLSLADIWMFVDPHNMVARLIMKDNLFQQVRDPKNNIGTSRNEGNTWRILKELIDSWNGVTKVEITQEVIDQALAMYVEDEMERFLVKNGYQPWIRRYLETELFDPKQDGCFQVEFVEPDVSKHTTRIVRQIITKIPCDSAIGNGI